MRIVYLLTTPDLGAGTERTFFSQAALMADHHQVSVVGVFRTSDRPHYDVDRRVRVKYLVDARGGRGGRPSRLVPGEWDNQFTEESDRALPGFLRRMRADIVVTSTPALAYLASQLVPSGVAVVHQEHRPSMLRGDGITPLVAAAARLDLLTSLTQRSQDWLAERLGASAPWLEVVENPLEPGYTPRSSLTNKLVVSAGRFSYQKRFDHLVRAFAVANELEPGWRLRIFGDGPLVGSVRREVWNAGLSGLVDIVGPTTRMAAEMSKASIFAMSSRYEGLPMVGIEAAAVGLPLVAYDVETGPAEIVQKAGGGLLAPNGSVDGLGAALATLMASPDMLAEYSRRALEGSEEFSPTRIRDRWDSLFREVRRHASRAPRSTDSIGVAPVLAADAAATAEAGATPELGPQDDPHERLLQGLTVAERHASHARRELARASRRLRDVLRQRGVEAALLDNDRHGQDVVVAEDDREVAMAVLGGLVSEHGWSLDAFRGRGKLNVTPWRAEKDAPPSLGYATHVDVWLAPVDETPDPADHVAWMSLEFWRRKCGTLHAPRRNLAAEWVDERAWAAWAGSGASTVLGRPLWNQIDFPIDVVYTWVDGSDPVWVRRRAEHRGDEDGAALGDGMREARFRNRNELMYSVAAVKKYMPWVRNIYVVTDGQTPQPVVEQFPEVVVVDHRDIFPDPGVLPVFNSHAIESCLHRINSLSEHFIYFNDDVIPMRPLAPEEFFAPNGVAKFFPSPVKINHGGFDDLPHLEAAANNRELLLRDFGFEITQSMLHTPHPHRRSVLEEMEKRYGAEFARTRAARFRTSSDYSVLSSLGQYYGYATGRYAPGEIAYRYVSLRSEQIFGRMRGALADPELQLIALGEPAAHEGLHYEEEALVRAFLEEIVG